MDRPADTSHTDPLVPGAVPGEIAALSAVMFREGARLAATRPLPVPVRPAHPRI